MGVQGELCCIQLIVLLLQPTLLCHSPSLPDLQREGGGGLEWAAAMGLVVCNETAGQIIVRQDFEQYSFCDNLSLYSSFIIH